jgi:nucleotide-binding universal stress UspA family protein
LQTDKPMTTEKIKKVLIALDYGPTAKMVAETGYSLASHLNAEIVLLHVIAERIYYTSADNSPALTFSGHMDLSEWQLDSTEAIKNMSLNHLESARKHLGDENIKTIIKEGEVAEAILETANELQAQVIVMGSHRQKWLDKIIEETVTEKVLQSTSLPLFVIPIADIIHPNKQ